VAKHELITSVSNENVRYVRSLHRRGDRAAECAYIAEGLRTLEEAMQARVRPNMLFYTEEVTGQERAGALLAAAQEQEVLLKQVSQQVMAAMSGTVTPSGLLAVVPMAAETAIPDNLGFLLIMDALRDPGNVGAILRSALAAGVDAVITTTGTVDLYNPKVVRAGMGAHFRLKLCLAQDWAAVRGALQGMQLWIARPRTGKCYWEVDWCRPSALLIGGEAHGVSSEAEYLAGSDVMIPMRQEVESLNAAIAASIMLFEASRQRSMTREEAPCGFGT